MTWTRETPTEPGFYWLKYFGWGDEPRVVQIHSADEFHSGLTMTVTGGWEGFEPLPDFPAQ